VDYASVTLTVKNDVADRLEVVTEPGVASFTEGGPSLTVDAGVQVSPNNQGISKATVRITSGYVKGRDVLFAPKTAGLKSTFSAATGTLTLSGVPLTLNPQAILRSVQYKNASVAPVAGMRTIALAVSDALGTGDPAYRQIQVNEVNSPPAVTITRTASSYTENKPPVSIAGTLQIKDPDNTTLKGATVAISSHFAAGEDVLTAKLKPGIGSNYDPATGVYTFTGTAKLSDYKTVLKSIKYADTSDGPSTATRTVSFTVNDGTDDSPAVQVTVGVVPVNDAPMLQVSNPALPDVNKNDTNPPGVTIAALLGGSVSDPDVGALTGIAVTSVGTFGGAWQFSINGTDWTPMGAIPSGKALLLKGTDYIRFVPTPGITGGSFLTYRAWDQTKGTPEQLGSLGVGGGTSALSLATDTASVRVS
jgi:hypothetical protein